MLPAERRKRPIVMDDDEVDDGRGDRPKLSKKNTLINYISSPDSKAPTIDVVNDDGPRQTFPTTRQMTKSRLSHAASSNGSSIVSNALIRPRSVRPTPSQSPNKKCSSKARRSVDESRGNIKTIFSNQSQKAKTALKSNNPPQRGEGIPLDLDSDPLSDEEDIGAHRASGVYSIRRKALKRSKDQYEFDLSPATRSIAHGQRFLRLSRSFSAHLDNETDQRPWPERFGPVSLDELVVHKKKVADVRHWLHGVLVGRSRQRLLILKGSAGTGKTTTMQLLAKDMGFEILEWRNPMGTVSSEQNPGLLSSAAQFEEFMSRGCNFGPLQLEDDPSTHSKGGNPNSKRLSENGGPKILLVEEFPNTFMRSGSALTSFRRTVLRHLANSTPYLLSFDHATTAEQITPVVMIVSETLLTTTSASADSFTAHRLLGPDILRHSATSVIEFNDIAPTLLQKAIQEIVKKEARVSGRRRTPGPQVIKRLGEIGDIRSAISSLEFLCVKGDQNADWGSKIAFAKSTKSSKDQALTEGEQRCLELISQREASLGIFHAVGKVVYNKRLEQSYPEGSEQALAEALPPHLSQMSRPKPSEVTVDTLIDETGTDTLTFISALHENYVLSCERTGSAHDKSSVDYINGCIEYLSESDLLSPSWDVFFGGKGMTGNERYQGSHVLRQDEMAFEVAVRGLLFSLPSPVKRRSTMSGASNLVGGDASKMYFPSSIKLWRTKEELESLVDLWASELLKGGTSVVGSSSQLSTRTVTNGAATFRKLKQGSVVDLINNPTEQIGSTPEQGATRRDEQRQEPRFLLALGSSARLELVQERLPYMAHVMRSRQMSSWHSLWLRDLEKVVSFHSVRGTTEEEGEVDDAEEVRPAGEEWATDKPSEEVSPKKRPTTIKKRPKESESSIIGSPQVERLVLSDDDIEDD